MPYGFPNSPPNAGDQPLWFQTGAGEAAALIEFYWTQTEEFGEVDRFGITRNLGTTNNVTVTPEKYNTRSPASYVLAEQDRFGTSAAKIIATVSRDFEQQLHWSIRDSRYPIYIDASDQIGFTAQAGFDGIDHTSYLSFEDVYTDINREIRGRRNTKRGYYFYQDHWTFRNNQASGQQQRASFWNVYCLVQKNDWRLSHETDAAQKNLLLEEAPPEPAVGVFNLMQTGIGK